MKERNSKWSLPSRSGVKSNLVTKTIGSHRHVVNEDSGEVLASIDMGLPVLKRKSEFEEAWSGNVTKPELKSGIDIVKTIKTHGVNKFAESYGAIAGNIEQKSIDFVSPMRIVRLLSPAAATVNMDDDNSLKCMSAMYAASIKLSGITPENINVKGKTPEIQARLEKIVMEEFAKVGLTSCLINGKVITPPTDKGKELEEEPAAQLGASHRPS